MKLNNDPGIYIGLGALTFNYTFPIKIVAPPYNWKPENSGLIALGNIIGCALAVPFASSSDRIAAWLTKRNNGIREAEMRLWVLVPVMLIAPAGLILYGFTAQKNLPWLGYFFGVGMTDFTSYFYFSFVLAYAVDSMTANTAEMLIAMNLGKQAISFGMGIYLLDWILKHGYAKIIAGAFCAVLAANNLAVLLFLAFGKRIRAGMHNSWLGRLHTLTAKGVEVA